MILGISSLIEVIFGLDIVLKSECNNLKNQFFLWLWFLIPITVLTIIEIVQNSTVFYDAFLLPIFPALSIISALGFRIFYRYFQRYKIEKFAAVILLFLVVLSNLSYADLMIRSKVDSYDTLKDAGIWIKSNSNPSDNILARAVPAITYYSERACIFSPDSEDNLSQIVKQNNTKFFVLSVWELPESQEWSLDYSQRNPGKFIPIISFPINSQEPTTIIFRINSSAF
jgi:hypothetical protein